LERAAAISSVVRGGADLWGLSLGGGEKGSLGAPGGGHPHTPYRSCEHLLVGWTATTHTVLWERSYGSHVIRNYTTTQPYSAVAPYERWGGRGVLGISLERYRRFGPLLLRQ